MPRYIDAEKVLKGIEELKESPWFNSGRDKIGTFAHVLYIIRAEAVGIVARLCIEKEPTADVEEVRHGEWIKPYSILRPFCSKCKAVCKDNENTKYCHECGAKMDGKEKEDVCNI